MSSEIGKGSSVGEFRLTGIAFCIFARSIISQWKPLLIVLPLLPASLVGTELTASLGQYNWVHIVLLCALGITVPIINITAWGYFTELFVAETASAWPEGHHELSLRERATQSNYWKSFEKNTRPTAKSRKISLSIMMIGMLLLSYANIFLCIGLDWKLPGDATHLDRIVAAIYYSVATFTTLGYGDIVATTSFGRLIAIAEVLNGFVIFGLFISYIYSLFPVRASSNPR